MAHIVFIKKDKSSSLKKKKKTVIESLRYRLTRNKDKLRKSHFRLLRNAPALFYFLLGWYRIETSYRDLWVFWLKRAACIFHFHEVGRGESSKNSSWGGTGNVSKAKEVCANFAIKWSNNFWNNIFKAVQPPSDQLRIGTFYVEETKRTPNALHFFLLLMP